MYTYSIVLPDFPRAKRIVQKRNMRLLRSFEFSEHVALSLMGHYRQHEGAGISVESAAGVPETKVMEEHEFTFRVSWDEVKDLVGERLERKLREMAREIGGRKLTNAFEEIHRAVEKAGNVHDAGGRTPDGALLLDLMDSVEMTYDSDGKPTTSFILHPDMMPAFKRASEEIDGSPQLCARKDEIERRQREQWRFRENRRKLVD